MLPLKFNFLHHVRWLRAAARTVGAQVLMEFDSTAAYVRQAGRHWVLEPQFMASVNGGVRYFRRMPEEQSVFTGWRAGSNAGWPASTDKLVFKRAVSHRGLRTPEYALGDDGLDLSDVLVKRAVGSFGDEVHGPYRSGRDRPLRIADGEFYERFIDGTMLKIWYFRDQPIVLETDIVSKVVGDGMSTVLELLERRLSAQTFAPLVAPQRLYARVSQFLAYDGRDLDYVPPAGAKQPIEFRYGSELGRAADRVTVDLAAGSTEWVELCEAGPIFLDLIPDGFRPLALYTVDAVRDTEGRLWFLEINANPVVHPLLYAPMLQALVALPPSDPSMGTAP